MSGLRLDNVKTVFDGGGDIGPVTLDLQRGEMLALLGASGSGKTTTLRMIAGLSPLVQGRVFFDGKDISQVPVRQRHVGMVFQNFGLFPHLNVQKNISFGLRMQGDSTASVIEKLNWIIEKTRLKGLENRFASELSGGQKQRVALARTLVMDPDILLLDEPLSNLDANLREEMSLFIKELQRDLGITTVFVTHDQDEALMLADQVVVMAAGHALQQGSPTEVFERPVSRTVADFMGGGNFLSGTECAVDSVQTEIGLVAVSTFPEAKKTASKTVTLMIRPEHIRIDSPSDDVDTCQNFYRGRVVSVRYHGGFIAYEVKVNTALLSVRQDSRSKFDVGNPVTVSFNSVHVWTLPDDSLL